MIELKQGERIDELHRKGYKIIQHSNGFCFGVDAVLLTDFTEKGLKSPKVVAYKVLDMGTGTGIIPILLSARNIKGHFTGMEVQKHSAEMASRSVKLNGLEDVIQIINCNVTEALNHFDKSSFDIIVTNPPYMAYGDGLQNPDSAKAIARHEITASLKQWIEIASSLLKVNGKFFMVHRPHRLTDIMATLDHNKLTVKRLRMVHPYIDQPANMVLIEAVRYGNSQVIVEKPLIIYKEQQVYTEEIYDIYGYDKPL